MTSVVSSKDRYRTVACCECRRSKTKCNRTWPCHACVKRGCEDICPEGILIKPKRDPVTELPSAAGLREENRRLTDRIRELESAATSNTSSFYPSSPSHSSSSPTSSSENAGTRNTQQSSQEEVLAALGTLSIGDHGQSSHHNQAACAESLFDSYLKAPKCQLIPSGRQVLLDGMVLPSEILRLAELFPIGPSAQSTPELRHLILTYIPPADKVLNLVDRYYRHIACLYDPIPREQFLTRVYDRLFYGSGDVSTVPFDHVSLLFIVLAQSMLTDVERSFSAEDAEAYFFLALAAFSLESHLTAPSLASIQALHMITMYTCMAEKYDAEERWLLMGTTTRMALGAGLHRDFSSWLKCDTAEIERRRKLFWEVFVYDTWMSFLMGRPAALANNKQVETKFPQDLHTTLTISGEPEPSFHNWKYNFMREIVSPLLDELMGTKPPSYPSILRIDASIRRFPVPPSLQAPPLDEDATKRDMGTNVFSDMQKYYVLWVKETCLLSLHRSFFAHAISVSPDDILQCKYAPSILAAFRSASVVVRRLRQFHMDHPLTARLWTAWSSVFSAAIILGKLVVRVPGSQLVPSALQDLDLACDLIEKGLVTARSIRTSSILRKLQTKAHEVYAKRVAGRIDTRNMAEHHGQDDEDDELSIFGGQTRLLLSRSLNNAYGDIRPTPNPKTSQSLLDTFYDTHPELWNDTNTLTAMESLSNMVSENPEVPSTDTIMPDLSGMSFDYISADLGDANVTPQQDAESWQEFMGGMGHMA